LAVDALGHEDLEVSEIRIKLGEGENDTIAVRGLHNDVVRHLLAANVVALCYASLG
jgi:hypothetical protein